MFLRLVNDDLIIFHYRLLIIHEISISAIDKALKASKFDNDRLDNSPFLATKSKGRNRCGLFYYKSVLSAQIQGLDSQINVFHRNYKGLIFR